MYINARCEQVARLNMSTYGSFECNVRNVKYILDIPIRDSLARMYLGRNPTYAEMYDYAVKMKNRLDTHAMKRNLLPEVMFPIDDLPQDRYPHG